MNNTKFFELMGDINDKYFAENYEEPLRAERIEMKSAQKRGAKRWIIPVSVAAAACLAVGIAAPRIADMIRGRNVIDRPSTSDTSGAGSVTAKTLQDWLALPHNAINAADKSVMFSSANIANDQAVLTFEGDRASDIYAVDDCTVRYAGYANAPYLGYVVLVQFNNGLWGLYRNAYDSDDFYDTEISVKAGDKLKAGDKIGTMYPDGFKLLISAEEPSSELFAPKYPELAEWEKREHTFPITFHEDISMGSKKPETLTENLGYRGWHKRFWFMDGSEPVYAVSDGTVYAINDHPYDKDIPAKLVVIKLNTGFDTPLYAIYNCISSDGLTLKVGDDVKEGDVIGNTSLVPMTAPSGITLTISTVPYVPEVDEDGNFVSPDLFKDWVAAPHNAINSTEKNVTLKSEPVEGFKERALMTIEGTELTDIYAIADCTVTGVRYANAPYLGKVVTVDFGNDIWGIYRSSYKYDELSSVEIAVKEGDTLKAGDKIGTMFADGFKLVVGRGYDWDILSPKYAEIAKWKQMSDIAVIQKDGVTCTKDEHIGYLDRYSETYVIDSSTPVYAMSDGKVVGFSDSNYSGRCVVIELDWIVMGLPLYMIYDGLAFDSVDLKVGDTVKEGDVIGDAFASPDGGPVTFAFTMSVNPEISELDDDGNPIR